MPGDEVGVEPPPVLVGEEPPEPLGRYFMPVDGQVADVPAGEVVRFWCR